MNLWPVEHFFFSPQSEEKSVQMVRGSSFRSDFLQNPYFKYLYKFFWNSKIAEPVF